MLQEILNAFEETLFMVFIAAFFILLIGLPISLSLAMCQTSKNRWMRKVYAFSNSILTITASMPYLWLILSLIPLKHFTESQEITLYNALIPLSLTAMPAFIQSLEKIFQGSLHLKDTLLMCGINSWHFITRVLLPEARPKLIEAVTSLLIQLIGYAIIVGILGKGGIGDLLFYKGYKAFDSAYLLWICLLSVFIIQILYAFGKYTAYLSKK